MHLINDYSQQVLTDQRGPDLARLAEHNRPVWLALRNRVSWWRRLLARPKQRIGAAAQRVWHSVEWRCPSAGSRAERDPGVEICCAGRVAELRWGW